MKSAPILPLILALGIFNVASTATAAWVRLPNDQVRLVNLAADRISSTNIQAASGVSQPANLIDEDPAKVSQIDAGKSSVTIRLNNQQNVDMVSLSNGGASGVINILGSTDNKSWSPLAQKSFDSTEVAVTANFAPTQLRYVRLDFDTASSGAINNVVITGAAQSAGASSDSNDHRSNLACAIGGARPIYASPTPSNLGTKEFDINIFRFPKSSQPATTVVYDLGNLREVDDVSLAYDFRPTRVDVFAFDQLPEKKDWRGKQTLDPAFLDSASPVVSGVDSRGLGRIKLKPKGSINTQYVIIRVQPLAQSSGLGTTMQNIAAQFGFEASQQIATPPGGSTLGSIYINGALSSAAFAQAAANALGNGGETTTTETNTTSTSLDQANTALIPPAFLGQYDYRMTGGTGGGGGGDDDDDRPIVNNIIRPIIRPVQQVGGGTPDQSGGNP